MFPLLLMLLLLPTALRSESDETNTGRRFLVVFPENTAYYHPTAATNKVQMTALHDNTEVTLTQSGLYIGQRRLSKGQNKVFDFDATLALRRENVTADKTIRIKSSKVISVQMILLKATSVQTALVIPDHKLGTNYLIPPVPTIPGTTSDVTTAVTERRPFKVIIVNGDQENVVTVGGENANATPVKLALQPHEIAQIDEFVVKKVESTEPVAVLFGHSCAIRSNCTCGMLFTILTPANDRKLKFYIPPSLRNDAEGDSFILLSEEESSKVEAYDPNSPLVETAGTAVLYRPGFLLPLIAETDFGTCYVIKGILDAKNWAVILVHKDNTDGVRLGQDPLPNPEWQELKGTHYVSTYVNLTVGKSVIWHGSSKMAVYFLGKKEGAWFGNPAPIISTISDFRGCVVTPELFQIGEASDGWRESIQHCKSQDMELVSLPYAKLREHIYQNILQAKIKGLNEVWIGLRRSSQTGAWYWLNKAAVGATNWANQEPGEVEDGQCAIMSLGGKTEDFGWRDEDCCKAARPVCYRHPVFFPM